MRSSFNRSRTSGSVGARPKMDETYDLRGLNLSAPDQVMPAGETPFTINSRMYARADDESRVAIRTRKGTLNLSAPIGQTADVLNNDTSTGELNFSVTRLVAQPFTALTDGALTMLELELKKVVASTGHIIVEIADNAGGTPGSVIAESSILNSSVSTDFQWLPAYFIDAPELQSGSDYWIIVYVQDNGSGEYYLRQTADSGALDLFSEDERTSWNNLGVSFRFKSYLSTVGGVKGYHRRYPQNKQNRTIISQLNKIYAVTDAGVATEIDSAMSASARATRFEMIDDKSIWVDGATQPRWWNGTDPVSNISGAPANATHVIAHKNRLFFVVDKVLVKFSDLYSFENYPLVNFFYVPNPKSPDEVTGWCVFQDNLVIFTHETKYILSGSDIASFTMRQAIGTKGAVSQEVIAVDRNFVYFMADDGLIYRFNGVTDELISGKMEPELQSIQDKKNVRMTIYRNQLRVYYPKKPNPTPNRMALYDIEYQQWFMDTGRPIAGCIEWAQDDNELIEFSSKAGWFFFGESGYSDVGKAIDFKYWTNYKTYGSGAARKRIKRFRPILRVQNANYSMLVGKDMDFQNRPLMQEYSVSGGGAKWGSFKWGDGTKWGSTKLVDRQAAMSGRGKHIQYRFERKGVETPVEIYGYISIYKEGRPR